MLNTVENKEKDWKSSIKNNAKLFGEDITEALNIIGKAKVDTSDNYKDAMKLVKARINNLETNLHIEIDMERIEDRSKALSYIGIEVADALKGIPTPVEVAQEEKKSIVEQEQYIEETRVEVKPSLWQRIKQSRVARALSVVFRLRLSVQDALPEGRGE